VEDHRQGQGAGSYVVGWRALMKFIDFILANKAAFPSFDEATLVIRYSYA